MNFFKKVQQHYLLLLAMLFFLEWTILAIDPYHRQDWLLENILVFALVTFLFFSHKKLSISRTSYALIIIFLMLHALGAHYTYSKVPYDAWFKSITGKSLNVLLGWERNQYDRIIHFIYGLLLAYPIKELYANVIKAKGFWHYFLPMSFIMSLSTLYELIEWGAAEILGGDLGITYVGAQGDVWDGQKDVALASLGALITMLLSFVWDHFKQKPVSVS